MITRKQQQLLINRQKEIKTHFVKTVSFDITSVNEHCGWTATDSLLVRYCQNNRCCEAADISIFDIST